METLNLKRDAYNEMVVWLGYKPSPRKPEVRVAKWNKSHRTITTNPEFTKAPLDVRSELYELAEENNLKLISI